jgi:hypothetical protein
LTSGKLKSAIRRRLDRREIRSRAARVWRYVDVINDDTRNIRKDDVILVTMFRDERRRIRQFIAYYRNLGVNHFIMLDNDSTDGGARDEIPGGRGDVSIFSVSQGFRDSGYGVDWMNAFLSKYCVDHWTFCVDIDEYFVFPKMESRPLAALLNHLADSERRSVFALMLDMYPKGGLGSMNFAADVSPIAQAEYFDSSGYYSVAGKRRETWIRGGPRLRVFFRDAPEKAPALNKIPLIHWRRNTFYFTSQHVALPDKLNAAHGSHDWVTGALLHFKFDAHFGRKVVEEAARGEHYAGAAEYKAYADYVSKHGDISFYYPGSHAFRTSHDVLDANLLSLGIWS